MNTFITVNNPLLSFDDAKQFCREQYNATLASNLSLDDYSGLFDPNIIENRGFRIGLVSENNICRNGSQPSERPYYWYNQPNTCVNGSPLKIQNDPSSNSSDCETVQILVPSDSETLPMARLIPCRFQSRFICQTTNPPTTTATTTIFQPTTAATPFSENLAAIVGVATAIGFVVLVLLFFLIFRRTKCYKNMKSRLNRTPFYRSDSAIRNISNNLNNEVYCRSLNRYAPHQDNNSRDSFSSCSSNENRDVRFNDECGNPFNPVADCDQDASNPPENASFTENPYETTFDSQPDNQYELEDSSDQYLCRSNENSEKSSTFQTVTNNKFINLEDSSQNNEMAKPNLQNPYDHLDHSRIPNRFKNSMDHNISNSAHEKP